MPEDTRWLPEAVVDFLRVSKIENLDLSCLGPRSHNYTTLFPGFSTAIVGTTIYQPSDGLHWSKVSDLYTWGRKQDGIHSSKFFLVWGSLSSTFELMSLDFMRLSLRSFLSSTVYSLTCTGTRGMYLLFRCAFLLSFTKSSRSLWTTSSPNSLPSLE